MTGKIDNFFKKLGGKPATNDPVKPATIAPERQPLAPVPSNEAEPGKAAHATETIAHAGKEMSPKDVIMLDLEEERSEEPRAVCIVGWYCAHNM